MELYMVGKYKSLVAKIAGELDHHAAENVRDMIDRELQKTGAVNLIFDFSRTSFMDSSGIGVIMGRYKIVTALGGKIVISGASQTVERIIKMSGIGDIIKTVHTVEEAFEEVTENVLQ